MGRRIGRECSLKPVEVDVSVRSLVVGLRSLASRAAPVAGVVVAAAGCRGHASAEDCAKMTDHYVDLAVQESPGAARMAPAQAAAVREVEQGLKRAEPSYRRVEDRCATVMRSEVRCALGATTTSEWEACLGNSHPDAR